MLCYLHGAEKVPYLIRDVYFTIQTDHKNFIYLNTEGSKKVIRWKHDIMEYNFDVEHIPGRNNEVADAFSRLCALVGKTTTLTSNGDLAVDPEGMLPMEVLCY